MNLFILVWNYIIARPLNTVLNLILLGLGVGVITILLIFNRQLQEKITDTTKGIDLVIGAKGSPLQLILCNIFHIDFPTGNIKLSEAERITKNRLIKKAIPLALGDSYNDFRIIGTNISYPELYKAELSEGEWWIKEMDVTIGSNVASSMKLKPGDSFVSTHGMTSDGHAHEERNFLVKGVLRKTNSVVDNLILTSIESVWAVHEGHSEDEKLVLMDSTNFSSIVPSVHAGDSLKEITSLLIQYRSPMAAIQLPRLVNSQTSLQAASPAFESARLFSILGVGVQVLSGFAYVLIFISALSIFIALYNSLKDRKYDLAIMRTMGATRQKLFVSVILESLVLSVLGVLLGLAIGHGTVTLISEVLPETEKAGITGLIFYHEEWMILAGSLLLGIVCALVPAIQAYRTDISKVLAGN